MRRTTIHFGLLALAAAALVGCGHTYSPDTYATTAVQQASKVDRGIIVGVREVSISAAGTVGGVTGAAVGAAAGSQAAPAPASAFTMIGGSLLGGIAGVAAEHATRDTKGWEYIVRKTNGELASVAQTDKKPLRLGDRVLVIAGAQARVVPDYTKPVDIPPDMRATDKPSPAASEAPGVQARPAEPAVPIPSVPGVPHDPEALPPAAISALPKS